MIITPKELKQWYDNGKRFTVLDMRPKNQIEEFPLIDLRHTIGTPDSIDKLKGDKVLVCQFGIVTEGMIIEYNLQNSYSLLGAFKRGIIL